MILKLPAEVRLSIYRELLLPTPDIYFGIGKSDDQMVLIDPEDEWEDEEDEDELDLNSHSSMPDLEGFESDSDVDMRGGGGDYLLADEANSLSEEDVDQYCMHPAILRTNR
jgi:hypothetical protein